MQVKNKKFTDEISGIEAISPEKGPSQCYNAYAEVFGKHPAHPVLTKNIN